MTLILNRWAIVFALISWSSVLFGNLTFTLGFFAQALFLAYLGEVARDK
jgi:hypothetical protein